MSCSSLFSLRDSQGGLYHYPSSVCYIPLTVPRAPPAHIDQTVSDFDGVTFHISTPESKTKILISIAIRCFRDLVQYGAEQVLMREYGDHVVSPEPGYDFSVQIDLESLPAEKGGALEPASPRRGMTG